MEILTKKFANGFEIPVLGFGTWQLGGRMEHDIDNDDARDIQAIRNAIEAGIVHIDTAELYANGYTEELVGRAIEELDRPKLFIASKVKGSNATYDGIHKAVRASLARLGTDYLDLYMIHARVSDIPLEESMKAMNELVDAGLIRHIGVSNFSKETLSLAQSYSRNPIVANQVHYNLVYREPEVSGLLEYCQRSDVAVIAWRPLQYGTLADTSVDPLLDMARYNYPGKSKGQLALNWLISQPNVVAIFQTRDAAHLSENLGSVGWNMKPEEIEYLRNLYPNQQPVSDRQPLL